MNLENDRQLENTQDKLRLIDAQIEKARSRARSPENDESIRALVSMANQLREEIVRYESARRRQAS
jgi:hypothetical protein